MILLAVVCGKEESGRFIIHKREIYLRSMHDVLRCLGEARSDTARDVLFSPCPLGILFLRIHVLLGLGSERRWV